VKFCGAFELALRGHDETDSSENPGNFRGLVDFVASLDNVLEEHLKTAIVFKGTSKTARLYVVHGEELYYGRSEERQFCRHSSRRDDAHFHPLSAGACAV